MRKGRTFKYIYLLLCLTCITAGWTSARYVAEIEGVMDSARTAKFSYKMTTNQKSEIIDDNGQVVKEVQTNVIWNGIIQKTVDGLVEFIWNGSGDSVKMNMYDLTDADKAYRRVRLHFKIEYTTEVALKLYFVQGYEGTDKGTPKAKEWMLTIEDIQFTCENPAGVLQPGVGTASGSGGETVFVIQPSEGTIDVALTLDFGAAANSDYQDHYLNLTPTIVQVD